MDEENLKKILKILFEIEKQEHKNPVNSDDLKLLLDMKYKELLSYVKYLKEEGYLELKEFYGEDFEANITPEGIEKVKNLV
jgi:predicted transcriptional regulator